MEKANILVLVCVDKFYCQVEFQTIVCFEMKFNVCIAF